jgi:uncharacterized protein YciI
MLRIAAVLTAMMMVPAVTASTPPGARAEAAPAQTLYVVVYRPGPAWVAGKPSHQQKLGGHLVFIRGALADGRLVAGGPFLDGEGGMAIFRAASLEDARALIATDSAVATGVFAAELRPWDPRFDSGKPLKG